MRFSRIDREGKVEGERERGGGMEREEKGKGNTFEH